MATEDRDLVNRLLKQSILTLCREAVSFTGRLEVDGILCLTVDSQDQHVVKIHEFFYKNAEPETPDLSHADTSSAHRVPSSRTIIRYAPNAQTEQELDVKNRRNELKSTVIKVEPQDNIGVNETFEEAPQNYSPLGVKHSVHTGVNSLPSLDYSSLGVEKSVLSSARNIHCKKCNSILENVTLLQEHNMRSHGQFTCLVCLSTFTSRNNMKRHIRLHSGIKPYSCQRCQESFSRNDDFKRHLLKHTFQKPFRCAICKTGYSDRACVKSHMINDHNSKVFHVCPQCGETYIDLQQYQKHKKCHPEFQDYRCSLCSFTGSNALMYNKHMLTHGPPKEYKCSHCNESFSDPFMYTSHIKRHKGDELVRNYTCCFCDMSFTSFEQFQRHEHTHVHSKQHVCRQCNKVFRYPSNLREHMLTHLQKSEICGTDMPDQCSGTTEDAYQTCHGENSSATTTEGRKFCGDGEIETREENNNKIDADKETRRSEYPDGDEISGSSEYWCTECNHGFGSESKLQMHIMCKHEGKEKIHEDDEEAVNQTDSRNSDTVTEPLTGTQLETDRIYSQDTRSMFSNSSPFDENTIVVQQSREKNINYTSTVATVGQAKQRDEIYEAETVIDNTDSSFLKTREIAVSNVNFSLDHTTETNLSSVKDAMKEVQNIQFRFGIKSREFRLDGDSGTVNRQEVRPVPASNSGIKIQRTSYSATKFLGNNEGYKDTNEEDTSRTYCRDQKNNVKSDDRSRSPGTDSEPSVTTERTHATTLNLQIRNPGFERVVTPVVLFSTKAPFTCEVCEETFGSFDDFHEHGVKVHRRFICSYCGKVFTSRPNRERHVRYHTGEKPYKCDLCTASFLRGDDLKYHRTTKHADIKPFTCGACQASFSLPKDLEKHLKIYSDHRL